MIHRMLFYGLFLAAAAVLPYLSSEWLQASRATTTAETTSQANVTDVNGTSAATPGSSASTIIPPVQQSSAHSDAPPTIDLADAIRFDVNVPWLFQRWPRVTAGLPEGGLQGYRVPLVTGTREDDVAGSLTYYFTPQQICQKITFQGTTGDPRKITAHAVGQFGLIRQTSDDPGLSVYQTRWNGKPVSELRIKAAPVVKASAPHARYDVRLTLNSWARK